MHTSQIYVTPRRLIPSQQAVSATDPNSLTNILSAANNAQSTINSATTTVNAAQPLSLTDALTLQQSATGLTTSANQTVQALIQKKPVFDQLGVSSVVGQQLVSQKTAADGLGSAIVAKVPAVGQGIAQQSVGQITSSLDQAIAVYGGNTTEAAAPPAPSGGA